MFSIKVDFITLFPLSAVALAKEENLLLVFIFLPGKKINTLKILKNLIQHQLIKLIYSARTQLVPMKHKELCFVGTYPKGRLAFSPWIPFAHCPAISSVIPNNFN